MSRIHSRGFSMIELMVGVVIGLIGIVIISQMYAVSEDRKRSATGASDTQVAGNLAIFSIERAARMAGYGLSSASLLGCTTLAYNSGRSTPAFTFVIRPAWIEDGAAGTPDQITFMASGGSGVATLDGNVLNGSAASGAAFPLQSVAGFIVGSLVIAAESAKNCTLTEVGGIPAGTNTLTQGGTYSQPGGSGVAYTGTAGLFNVGFKAFDAANPQRTPFSVQRFRIVNESLRAETLIPYSSATDTDGDGYSDLVIASGVVQMQALYGLDDGNNAATAAPNRYRVTNAVYAADDGIVDNFVTATPASTPAAWRQMKVVRVAFLIRIGKLEREQVTTAEPTWNDGLSTFTMANAADGTDWRNYRYRVYEVDIPMRNILWTPS